MGNLSIPGLGTGRRTRTGGRANRKFGRAARRPGHLRYNSDKRWITNKARRVAKEAKRQAYFKVRKEKLVLG